MRTEVVRLLPIMALVALAGCGDRGPNPREQALRDEADVEAVKAAQEPPPAPVTPDKILYPDIEKYDLFGAGCNFAPAGSMGAIAFAQPAHGYMKIDGELVPFAPDAGSVDLPLGAKGKYSAGSWSFMLDIGEGEGERNGLETANFPAHFVLRNDRDQVVYEAKGVAQCGS